MSAIVISDGITRKVLHAHSTAPVSGDAIAKLPLVHRAPGELWTCALLR